jgi:hypothetical protein
MSMRVSPRRSVLASIAAGCCLAASVVAGGYAASGAMPFSEWPHAIFASSDAPEVALAQTTRKEAPVLTLPGSASESETRTEVIPLDEAATGTSGAGRRQRSSRRRASTLPQSESSAPTTDEDVPDSSPTTPPTPSVTETTEAPPAVAASPAAESGPSQPASTTPTTRRVTLTSPTATFASAKYSGSGQTELKLQLAVADAAQGEEPTTVALSLKLAPTDVQALLRTAQAVTSSHIALEAEVDVVDATVATAGEPACTDGTCLRVQMRFAQDTRPDPVDEPEVQLLDDGTALSNRVKVVVQIDPEDIGGSKPSTPSDPAPEPAPEAGAPTVLSLPLPAPDADTEPATDTATATVPETDPKPGTPSAPTVQIEAQLEVVEPTPPAETPEPEAPAPSTPDTTPTTPKDCPPGPAE